MYSVFSEINTGIVVLIQQDISGAVANQKQPGADDDEFDDDDDDDYPPMSYEFDDASRQTALANYLPLPSTLTYYGIRQTITYGEFWVGLSDLEIIFI